MKDKYEKTNTLFILDKEKNVIPASIYKWARFFENKHNERNVGYTKINGLLISTVFIGLIHNIFETMIFREYEPLDYFKSYATWEEAIEGHQKAIEWVKNNVEHN